MVQTETAIVEEHHVNIKPILDYIRDNRPYGFNIPLKYILLPALAIFLLVLGSSLIREPKLLEPLSVSIVSRSPRFVFSPIKNLFYKGYEVGLYYADTAEKINYYIYEEQGKVVVTTPVVLRGQAKIRFEVKIKKGIGPIAFWSKTYTYRFETGAY